MKNHAVIENGVVTNVVVWDGLDADIFAGLELVDTDGMEVGIGFTWADGKFTAPPISAAERTEQAAENKRYLTEAANAYIAAKQWPSRLALGRLSADETALFNRWLDYLDALNALDFTADPDAPFPVRPE